MIRNLIFDLDGTLIDSSDGVVEAVNYSLKKMNQPEQPPEIIKTYIGYPLSKMYPDFTDAPLDDLYRHFQVRAAETVVASTVPLAGVVEVLHDLKERGFTMAVATTKITKHINGIIDKFGWRGYFSALTGGDEVSQVKPDPEAFRLTLSRMGVESGETMVVGDTVNDVLAAKAIPIAVTAVHSPYGGLERLLASKPDHFIEGLVKLPGLLDEVSEL